MKKIIAIMVLVMSSVLSGCIPSEYTVTLNHTLKVPDGRAAMFEEHARTLTPWLTDKQCTLTDCPMNGTDFHVHADGAWAATHSQKGHVLGVVIEQRGKFFVWGVRQQEFNSRKAAEEEVVSCLKTGTTVRWVQIQ